MQQDDYTLPLSVHQISELIGVFLNMIGDHGTNNVFVVTVHNKLIKRLLFELNLIELINGVGCWLWYQYCVYNSGGYLTPILSAKGISPNV